MKRMILSIATIATLVQTALAGTDTVNATTHLASPVSMRDGSFVATINLGYANYGVSGLGNISYKWGKYFITAGYYKSHVCVLNDDKGTIFAHSKSCDRHITILSASLSGGIVLPGKLSPCLSVGISISDFIYEKTTPDTHILSWQSFWATAVGKEYGEEVLNTDYKRAIGVPVAFDLHFAQKRNIGFVTGLKADINLERIFVSAHIGVRLGKMLR